MRDTIDMAREAGIEFQRITGILGKEIISTMGSQRLERIERFEALVRADEREACARVCVKISNEFKSMYCGDEMEAALVCEKIIRARGKT